MAWLLLKRLHVLIMSTGCRLIVYRLLDFANQAASVTMVQFFGTMLGVYSLAHIVYSAASLVIVIGSKWLVIGKRQPGDEYSWDVSSYCAR